MQYLDPLVVAKLGGLKIKAKYATESFLSGIHRTKQFGYSQEFTQHRQYSKGDEMKFIDWKVYARLDKFFVKQFQSESSLRAYVLLDSSGSMSFSSNSVNKLEYGKALTATMAYILIRQGDSIGILDFDKEIKNIIPPRSNKQHLSVIMESLTKIKPGEDTDISKTINELSNFLKKRSLVVLISDLFDKQENVIKSIKNLQAHHHEIVILHTIDSAEVNFPYGGEVLIELLEPPFEKFKIQADEISSLYRRLFLSFVNEYEKNFQKMGVVYRLITTDTPIEKVFISVFKK
jgi:uncharacterized protein (DUF58 family)